MRDIVERARDALEAWDVEGADEARALERELHDAVDDVIEDIGGPTPHATIYGQLPAGATVFHATLAFELEFGEGGARAYLRSAAATGLPEAAAAYRRIGATAFADVAEQAAALFPRGLPPREVALVQEIGRSIDEDDADALDTAYDAAFEHEDPHRLRLEYLVQAPEEFAPRERP